MGSCLSKSVKVDIGSQENKQQLTSLTKSKEKMDMMDENILDTQSQASKQDDGANSFIDAGGMDGPHKDHDGTDHEKKPGKKRLTPEEIEENIQKVLTDLRNKIEKAFAAENYNKADSDGHFPVTTRNLAVFVVNSYFTFKSFVGVPLERKVFLRRAIANVLMESKSADLFSEVYRYYGHTGWTSVGDDGAEQTDKTKWGPLSNSLLLLMNYADASSEFAEYIATCDGLLDTIKHVLEENLEAHLNGKHKEKSAQITKYSISLAHNISVREVNVCLLRDKDFVALLKPYLQSPQEMSKLNVLATLAAIVDEKESEIINANKETVKLLMTCLQKGLQSELRRHNGWSCKESALTVRLLARNDANKKMLSDLGAVELLVKVGQCGNDEEKYECVHAIWALAFDPDIRQIMVQNEDLQLVELLQDIKNTCPIAAIKKACNGALWTMREELASSCNEKYRQLGLHQQGESEDERLMAPKKKKKATKSESEKTSELRHIMISYQWADQKTLIVIRDRLKANGMKVWMDIDQMAGSTLQAMADAVENADFVLMAMSHKYKDSPNCRAEAEYAFKTRKKIIPLLMERGYVPDGWLGFILGAKLFFDFSGKYPFENKISDLLKEISLIKQKVEGSDGKIQPETTSTVTRQPVDSVDSQQLSHPVTRPNPVSMTTVSKVRAWKPSDVQNWINKNNLNSCGVSNLTGGEVALLMMMKQEAPEFFYKCLQTMLTVNDLLTMSKIVWALTDLSDQG